MSLMDLKEKKSITGLQSLIFYLFRHLKPKPIPRIAHISTSVLASFLSCNFVCSFLKKDFLIAIPQFCGLKMIGVLKQNKTKQSTLFMCVTGCCN